MLIVVGTLAMIVKLKKVMFEEIFEKKRMIPEKLTAYGFQRLEGGFVYECTVMDGEFTLRVRSDALGSIDTVLTECDGGEEYLLYKTTAQGSYVGEVRAAVSQVLSDIADNCFEASSFKQSQTEELLKYAELTYGSYPEFLWKDSENSVLRRKDSGKWYAALLVISKSKLGLDSNKTVEVVNMHARPETVESLLCRSGVYPAWHMNKKSWYTVILDGSVKSSDLFELLDESYRLAVKK